MKLNKIAAAIALVGAAASANAAIDVSAPDARALGGELFLTVWDQTQGAANSVVVDLGLTQEQFIEGGLGSYNTSVDLSGMNLGEVTWGVFATSANGSARSFLTTTDDLATMNSKTTGAALKHNQLYTDFSGFVASVNGGDSDVAVNATVAAQEGQAGYAGDLVLQLATPIFNVGIDESVDMLNLYNGNFPRGTTPPEGYTAGETNSLLGTWTLDANGGLSFSNGGSTNPVPVPAAVWLLASGLLGLVGVSRRRKQA